MTNLCIMKIDTETLCEGQCVELVSFDGTRVTVRALGRCECFDVPNGCRMRDVLDAETIIVEC